MHIVDGVVATPVLITSTVLALSGVAVGLKRLESEAIPKVALLSAAFFVASLIHIPVGPVSAHLILTGLMGLILGWAVFPAVLIGLLLQALFFGFGGVSVLGINTLNMALPAVFCHYLFLRGSTRVALNGFLAGMSAIGLSGLMVAATLGMSGEEFLLAAKLLLVGQIPLMLIEGAITAASVSLLFKVRPDIFVLAPVRLTNEAA
ncbi:MAG: cobalt transporter CbiM [Chromatiales bacterium]|nr:cobalt transporter CbiM [Chromatiales bacterium]